MYYTKMNLDINKLKIQLGELSEVKWFSMNELQNMIEKGALNTDQVEFFNKCVKFLSINI